MTERPDYRLTVESLAVLPKIHPPNRRAAKKPESPPV